MKRFPLLIALLFSATSLIAWAGPGDPGSLTMTFRDGESLHLGDAASTIVNGVYLPNGTANGYPKYQKDNSIFVYKVANGRWYISMVDGSEVHEDAYYYSRRTSTVDFVIDGRVYYDWELGYNGASPAPERWLDGFGQDVILVNDDGSDLGEDDERSRNMTVYIPSPSSNNVTVSLSYGGTATGGGVDYTAPASVIIPAGQKQASVTITGVDDAIEDTDETITVSISSVTNGTYRAPYTQTLTIYDDDAPFPTILIASGAAVGGMGETVNGTYTQVGTRNGVPEYYRPNPGIYLFMDANEIWYFNTEDGDYNAGRSLYSTDDNYRRPYLEDDPAPNNWVPGDVSPGAPGPTMSIGVAPPPPVLVECLINGSFELPDLGGQFDQPYTDTVPGWNTVNFDLMEYWPADWAAPAPDGAQIIELYSNGPDTIYQDFQTTSGDVLTYSFYHRQRDSAQELANVAFGAPGATTVVGTTAGSTSSAWTEFTGTYTVPSGQTLTRFEIQGAVASVNYGGTGGNLIDAVSVQGASCPPPEASSPTIWFALSSSSLPGMPEGSFGEDEGTMSLIATVLDNEPVDADVVVNFTFTDVTATRDIGPRKGAGQFDYSAPSSVTILAGESYARLDVNLNDDDLDEADETFTVVMAPGTGYDVNDDYVETITILDNDAPPVVSLSLDPPGDPEGLAAFTIEEDGGETTGKVKVIATLDAPSSFNIQIPLTFPDLKEGGLTFAKGVVLCGASKNCVVETGDYSISENFIYIPAGETGGSTTILAIDNVDYVGDRNAYIVVGSPLSNVTAKAAPDDRVTVTIKEDEGVPFKAVDDNVTTTEDTPATFDILANDDAGGIAATDILAIERGTKALVGTVEIVKVTGELPKVLYTPKKDWYGVDDFNYRATDGNGNKDVQKVTVTVTPVNDTPVATDYTVPTGTKEDVTFTVAVANLGIDVDQALRPTEALTVNFVTAPTKGTATFKDGVVTVVPTKDAVGSDSFEFTVTDNGAPAATSETKKVSWTLAPVFDEPTFTSGSAFEVERGQSITLKLDEILTTVDGPTLRLGDIRSNREAYGADKPLSGVDVTVLSVTGKNTLVLGKDQSSLTYTATTSFTGEETFSLAILHTVAGDYTAADVDNPAKTNGVANMDITINVTGVATVVSLTSPNGAPATNPLYRLGTGSGSPASRTYRIEASKNVGLDTVVELEATGRAAVGTDYNVFNDLNAPTLSFIIKKGTKTVDFTVSALACREDINKDGLVSLLDAEILVDYVRRGGPAQGEDDTYYDANGDGKIDDADRLTVAKRFLEIRRETSGLLQTCPETADLAIKTVTPGAVSSSAKSLSIPLKTIQTQRIELIAQIPTQLSAYEGGGSSGAAQSRFVAFAVKTENGSNVTSDVVVGVTTSGATEGSDFRLLGSDGNALTSLVIKSGTSGTTFSLEVLDDAVYEGDESVTITMASVTGASLTADAAKRSYTRTIVDNDVQPLVVPDAYLTINATTWCSQLLTRQLVSYRQILTAANYAGSLNPVSGPVTYDATTAYSLAVSGFLVPNELDRFIDITFPAGSDFCFGSAQELSVPFQIDVIETGQNPRTARMNVFVRIGSPNRAVVNVTQQTSPYVGQPITVESPTGTTLEAVQSTENPSPDPLPAGVQSPVGFLQFNVTNVTPGGTTTVEVALPNGVVLSDYWKYGPRLRANAMCPTSAGNAACEAAKKAHWYKWNLKNGIGAEQVGNVLKLHFKDGELGDFDLTANGVIIDPGVPVFTTNAAPVAGADAATSLEDGSVAIDFLSNDTDADGDVITFTLTTDPANGTWTDNGDGTGTYTPNADFFGTDSFTYTIDDGYANAEVGTVTIEVTGTPDAPVAVDDAAITTNTSQAVVNVFANDYDPDGDEPFYLSAISNPANGVASFQTDGTVTYTPNEGFVGQDVITYSITDGASGVFAQATVTITVTGALAGPVAADDTSTTAEETAVTVAVLSNDVDPQGDALTVATFTQGANGMVAAGESGTLVYTPAADFNGTDTFTYTATDGADTSSAVTVTVTVSAVNDAPVFATGSAIVAADGSVWIGGQLDPAMPEGNLQVSFTGAATDVDDADLTYTWQLASRTDFVDVLLTADATAEGASVPWTDLLDALAAVDMVPGDEITIAQRMVVTDAAGLTASTEAQEITFIRGLITANELGGELPTEYFLDGNYPNPFNPVTTIRFGLPAAGDVNVVVYDMMGRQVATLISGTLPAGVHEVQFDASNLPSGAYIYRLVTPAGQYVKTMMLLK